MTDVVVPRTGVVALTLCAVLLGTAAIASETALKTTRTLSVPPETSNFPDTEVAVPVSLDDAAEVEAYALSITFDGSIVVCLGAENGALTAGWDAPTVEIEANRVRVSNTGPVLSGSGVVVILRFWIRSGTAMRVSPVHFEQALLNGGALSVVTVDGVIYVRSFVPLPGAIMGVVRDATSGAGIAGALVLVSPGAQCATTNTLGEYYVGNLEAGTYMLEVSSPGYQTQSRPAVLLETVLTAIVDFYLSREAFPAPTGVSASDGAYPDRVRVTWNMVAGATGYQVYRNSINNTAGAEAISDWIDAMVFDDYSAPPPSAGGSSGCSGGSGMTYHRHWYWVKAKSALEESSFSAGDSGYVGTAKSACGEGGPFEEALPPTFVDRSGTAGAGARPATATVFGHLWYSGCVILTLLGRKKSFR